jgi:hypothetical protein
MLRLSLTIGAYSEAGGTGTYPDNIASLDYPHDLSEAIIASDRSHDDTDGMETD